MKFEIKPYGNKAVFLCFDEQISIETHQEVKKYYHILRGYAKYGIKAVIPSYCALTILFEPQKINVSELTRLCMEVSGEIKELTFDSFNVTIPVCYDTSLAIDWQEMVERTGKEWNEIIEIHSQPKYLVYMLGFVPGFLYLGGMNNEIAVSRKETPRLQVPKGSVGIADNQTGVYPMEIPGGWQIIGQTPVDMISAKIEMGDIVQFKPISIDEYSNFKGNILRELINED